MQQSLMQSTPAAHPHVITAVEQDRLGDDIKRALLQAPAAGDQKVRDRKKDIAKGFNKVHETLSQFLCHSYNNGRPITKQLTDAIGHFFDSRTTRGLVRKLRELSPIETREEGEFEQLQNAIDLGDTSTPTLIRFVTELDEYVEVLQEMRAAAVAELQKPGHVQ